MSNTRLPTHVLDRRGLPFSQIVCFFFSSYGDNSSLCAGIVHKTKMITIAAKGNNAHTEHNVQVRLNYVCNFGIATGRRFPGTAGTLLPVE